jgi:perosamine synthetase
MIVTDDDALAERCRGLRNLAMKAPRRFVHDEIGWNFRMTNMQAALGLAQLERLDDFVPRKRRMFDRYTEQLSDISLLQLPVVIADSAGFDADEAMRRLAGKEIGTRPFFWPMHEQPVYQRAGLFQGEKYPNAERIARQGFYLPSGLALTDEQIDRVCAVMHEVFA